MGYFSHSILVTELNFALKICKFWFFRNSFEIPEFIMEFEKIVLGYDMGCQFHSISSTEFKSTAQNVIYAQLKKFEINLNSKLMIKVFFFNSFIFVKLSFVTAKLNSVLETKWNWHPISYPKSVFSNSTINSGIWQEFQKNQNLHILSAKLSSVTKIEWKKYPIFPN